MSRRNNSIILNWPILFFRGAAFHSDGGRTLQIFKSQNPSYRPLRIFRNTKVHSLIKSYIPRTIVQRDRYILFTHVDVGGLETNYGSEIAGDRLHSYQESQLPEKKFTYAYNSCKAKVDQACSGRKVHFKYEIIFKEDLLKLYI